MTHHDCGKCQVDKSILELRNISEALRVLVNLIAHNTGDHGGCGGDGGNNLASNHLGLIAVTLSDLVVAGTQVRACRDKINVVVRVIILLEISGDQ